MRLFFCVFVCLSAVACSGSAPDDSVGQVSSAQRSAQHVEPGDDNGGTHAEPGDDDRGHDGGSDDGDHHRRGK